MRDLHVVLVSPEIHWNTGNAGRTCLAAGAMLHLVRPLGFSLDEIGEILRMSRSGKTPCSHVLEVAHRHLVAVEERIRQLQTFRERLASELEKWDGKQTPTCRGLCQIIADAEAVDTAQDVKVHLNRSRRGHPRIGQQ